MTTPNNFTLSNNTKENSMTNQNTAKKIDATNIDELRQALIGNTSRERNSVVAEYAAKKETVIAPNEKRTFHREGVSNVQIVKEIMAEEDALKKEIDFTRQFKYRVEDVQVALQRTMMMVYGTSGVGIGTETFFGKQNSAMEDIVVGLTDSGAPVVETVVRAGSPYEFAQLDAVLVVGGYIDDRFGVLGAVQVTTKKRREEDVNRFLDLVQMQLDSASIYKGVPLRFSKNKTPDPVRGIYKLEHMHVVSKPYLTYNDRTERALKYEVWGTIAKQTELRKAGEKTTIRALFTGEPGNGKTEAVLRTAKVAKDNGMTFIDYASSPSDTVDDLTAAFNMAVLLSGDEGAILSIEDIDSYFTSRANVDPVSMEKQITEMLDGSKSKGVNVSILMTTNHVEYLIKKVLRIGRIDAIIPFEKPGRKAMEELCYRRLGKLVSDNIDFDRVFESVEGLAFSAMDAVFSKAKRNRIISGDDLDSISTDDLVQAADSLMEQQRLHEASSDLDVKAITIDDLITNVIQDRFEKSGLGDKLDQIKRGLGL